MSGGRVNIGWCGELSGVMASGRIAECWGDLDRVVRDELMSGPFSTT